MKKILLTISLPVMLACGGGGSTTTPTATPTAQGTIKIALTNGSPSTQGEVANLKATPEVQTLPSPTNIRVLVTNASNGFLATQDVVIASANAVSIPVPATTGYKVEAISYVQTGISYGNNSILKYSYQDGIAVSPSVETDVTITLQPIMVTFTLPSTVVAGASFPTTFVFPSYVLSAMDLSISTSPFTTGVPVQYTTGAPLAGSWTTSLNAPTETVAGTFYLQGQFWLNANWVLSTESPSANYQFSFVYPDPTIGDSQASIPYTLPDGGINLGIIY